MAADIGPIVVESSKARRLLRELYNDMHTRASLNQLPDNVHVDPSHISHCLDRFNIWAGSLGVFRRGEASLDSRLQNHDIAREVVRLLTQLDHFITELSGIINGSREQLTWSQASLSIAAIEFEDFEEDYTDNDCEVILAPRPNERDAREDALILESQDLQASLDESITSLMRLSVQVYNSSKRAKFAKSSVDKNYTIEPDMNHIRDICPHMAGNQALIERLAKANAQRRQWLQYRQRHHEKLATTIYSEQREAEAMPLTRTDREDEDSIALFSASNESESTVLSGTKATTFWTGPTGSRLARSVPETSFERSSRATASEQRLMVPVVPEDMIPGEPYFCRYCCAFVVISGQNGWQKHVHHDLSSYTCVFGDCHETMFDSRHKWWAHEMEVHRRFWACDICGKETDEISAMKNHVRSEHSVQVSPDQNDSVAERFGKCLDFISANECPFCDYESVLRSRGYSEDEITRIPSEKFGRHLGRHLEQLALFVLPNNQLIEDVEHSFSIDEPTGENSQSEDNISENEDLAISEADLVHRLSKMAEPHTSYEMFNTPPNLALRWQPPQDFTPPLEDFDTDDADLLPVRQDPIFGGDLHTPGWARGNGAQKEGYCARCPTFHWVNIPDGSYRFHLTYLHGVPDSGVPLPRPKSIRRVQGRFHVWEGYCEPCDKWKLLKKTTRGWNWYRHWLIDHKQLIEKQTEAVQNGSGYYGPQSHEEDSVTEQTTMRNKNDAMETLDVSAERLHDNKYVHEKLIFFSQNDMSHELVHTIKEAMKIRSHADTKLIANLQNDAGETMLMRAASQGEAEVVDLLLDLGANPNAQSADQRTALDFAAEAGFYELGQRIITAGGDPSLSHVFKKIISDEPQDVIEPAGKADTKASMSKVAAENLSVIGRLACNGDIKDMRKLLGNNEPYPSEINIESGGKCGLSPLILASMHSNFDIIQLLLERGANINATSKQGWTALMLAAKKQDHEAVTFLVSNGADVNHLSPDRWTALAEATINGSIDIMRVLLEAGADPDIRAQSDWTPIMHAAYRGDIEAVECLLSAGASLGEISARDETVMLLAAAACSTRIVRRLLDAGCPPESAWSRMRSTSNEEGNTESEILSPETKGVPQETLQQRIERRYGVGWAPLMVACQNGSLEVVVMLLDAGANMRPRSPMMKTALEITKENGHVAIADHLSNWEARNGKGCVEG